MTDAPLQQVISSYKCRLAYITIYHKSTDFKRHPLCFIERIEEGIERGDLCSIIISVVMAQSSILGVWFSSLSELLLIIIQLVCFGNAYYVSVVLLGPLPLPFILLITLRYSRALLALQMSNSTHCSVEKQTEGSRFCKKC